LGKDAVEHTPAQSTVNICSSGSQMFPALVALKSLKAFFCNAEMFYLHEAAAAIWAAVGRGSGSRCALPSACPIPLGGCFIARQG